MCIVCNMADCHHEAAEDFLRIFNESRSKMKLAADAMLVCSKLAGTTEVRRRYDAVHKGMVKKIREWNKLEQKRENDASKNEGR